MKASYQPKTEPATTEGFDDIIRVWKARPRPKKITHRVLHPTDCFAIARKKTAQLDKLKKELANLRKGSIKKGQEWTIHASEQLVQNKEEQVNFWIEVSRNPLTQQRWNVAHALVQVLSELGLEWDGKQKTGIYKEGKKIATVDWLAKKSPQLQNILPEDPDNKALLAKIEKMVAKSPEERLEKYLTERFENKQGVLSKVQEINLVHPKEVSDQELPGAHYSLTDGEKIVFRIPRKEVQEASGWNATYVIRFINAVKEGQVVPQVSSVMIAGEHGANNALVRMRKFYQSKGLWNFTKPAPRSAKTPLEVLLKTYEFRGQKVEVERTENIYAVEKGDNDQIANKEQRYLYDGERFAMEGMPEVLILGGSYVVKSVKDPEDGTIQIEELTICSTANETEIATEILKKMKNLPF